MRRLPILLVSSGLVSGPKSADLGDSARSERAPTSAVNLLPAVPVDDASRDFGRRRRPRTCISLGGNPMIRRITLALCCAVVLAVVLSADSASAQQAFNRQWGGSYSNRDWERLYHYPYVWYPQNFWSSEYYKSSNDLYHRYPQEMRVPVYNKQWMNYMPEGRLYHRGHHFILDQF
jgi:hypothetical protein